MELCAEDLLSANLLTFAPVPCSELAQAQCSSVRSALISILFAVNPFSSNNEFMGFRALSKYSCY